MPNHMEQGLSWPATEDEGEAALAIPGTWLAIGTNPKGLLFFFLSGGIFTCQSWHCALGSFGAEKQLEKPLRGQIVRGTKSNEEVGQDCLWHNEYENGRTGQEPDTTRPLLKQMQS